MSIQFETRNCTIRIPDYLNPMKRLPRRGISSLITTAMLLTATAMMGTGLLSWSNSKLTTFENSLATSATSLGNKAGENLLIENVYFCYSTCNSSYRSPVLNMTLTNNGNMGLNVTQIKAGNYSWVLSPPVSLMPLKSYTFQQHFHWVSKTPYSISITSARGSVYSTQVAPP